MNQNKSDFNKLAVFIIRFGNISEIAEYSIIVLQGKKGAVSKRGNREDFQ